MERFLQLTSNNTGKKVNINIRHIIEFHNKENAHGEYADINYLGNTMSVKENAEMILYLMHQIKNYNKQVLSVEMINEIEKVKDENDKKYTNLKSDFKKERF